jgi:hypothetical protein
MKMAARGPNWTAIEHKLLCQAFIATSEDPIVGTDQKGAKFQEKMHVNYKKVVANHNRANGIGRLQVNIVNSRSFWRLY